MTRPASLSQAEIDQAKAWRDRPSSGRYIIHKIPRDWWCPKHGQVTKWHECHWEKPAGQRPRIEKL